MNSEPISVISLFFIHPECDEKNPAPYFDNPLILYVPKPVQN